ncbi:lipopolysaccharide-induced tumor necrosis factor-alpha factor homolog [Culicoides brevitarsis]|uniref:lipopolysaccharide-induced tumor necrosis factor-alpha factor homolog n=1 Tax=Culicoides brevitarsis TaxID=469753 RepID=UPI00307B8212
MDSKYPHPEQQQQQNMYPSVPPMNPPSYEQTNPQTTAVVQTVVTSIPLGPKPSNVKCPSCHQQITTNIKHENATKTHLFALLCCLIFWPCVWLPYTMDSCKDVNHYCPYCDAYLGAYKN